MLSIELVFVTVILVVLLEAWCCIEATAADEAEPEEMPVGSPLGDHEFVSDSFQTGNINADELKKEMDQLGVSDKMQDSTGTGLTQIHLYHV